MKRIAPLIVILSLFGLLSLLPTLVTGQTGVTAEAIGQVNLRSLPDTQADNIIGEIFNGTQYPVVGRSATLPWLLLGDLTSSAPIGWAFQDLLIVTGDINQVPLSTLDVALQPTPTASETLFTDQSTDGVTPTPFFGISGTVIGDEINIRYTPDVGGERVGVEQQGYVFQVVAYHTQFDWVQVTYDGSPNGLAWIYEPLLEYDGDIFTLPAISQTTFSLPTLTPTSAPIYSSGLPSQQIMQLSPGFQQLANSLWELVVERGGFDPVTSRIGALYVQDMQTGEAFTFGNNIAFSGTSINKIPILIDLFNTLYSQPDNQLAVDILNTMICSENVATNRLLGVIGDGDALLGADRVTEYLQSLGLLNTFIAAPYDTTTGIATSTPIPRAPNIPNTPADGTRTNPDPVNQMTAEEMGWMMSSLYQCGIQETGPLLENEGMTAQECRRMIYVMSNNNVDALLRAGVPADTVVAHKHGWIPDTHGNAAMFFTPGGDYVIVMMLFQPTWLEYTTSLPIIAEASRTVYNYFNPTNPMPAIRDGFIPEANSCNFAGSELAREISAPLFQATFTPLDSPFQPAQSTQQPTTSPTPSPTSSPSQETQPEPSLTPTFLG